MDGVNKFENFLNTINCNNCIFFVNKKCIEKHSKESNIERKDLKNAFIKCYDKLLSNNEITTPEIQEKLDGYKYGFENINNIYCCVYFDSDSKIIS